MQTSQSTSAEQAPSRPARGVAGTAAAVLEPLSLCLGPIRLVERIAAVAVLAAIVAVVFAGTLGRYSGNPVIWSDEVAQALFVWLSLLAADLTLQRAGHFSVDLFASLLPPRARLALDLLIYLLVGALLASLIVYGWFFVEISDRRPLPMTQVPSSFAAAALPIGFALMLATLVEQLLRRLSGRSPARVAEPRDVT